MTINVLTFGHHQLFRNTGSSFISSLFIKCKGQLSYPGLQESKLQNIM